MAPPSSVAAADGAEEGSIALDTTVDHVSRQYACRLLNTLASVCKGRAYLSQSEPMVKALVEGLRSDSIDPVGKEHVLATMQKLSLRQDMQLAMIEQGKATQVENKGGHKKFLNHHRCH